MKIINRIIFKFYKKALYSYNHRFKNDSFSLEQYLKNKSKTKWLDVGATDSMKYGFYACDLYPPKNVELNDKFFEWNAIEKLDKTTKAKIGKFDFIRMQHVFEHFTPEDGKLVLQNVFELLKDNGILLITVPDLKKFISMYKKGTIKESSQFQRWAQNRIDKNAPSSFYFSVFTHSLPHQCHLWCYDKEGLKYIVENSLENIKTEFLSIWDKRANIPFTHNRPLEDLCLMITKK